MTICIDTSVLVAAMVASEAFHEPCRALVAEGDAAMYSHGITETFSTLTGGRKAFRLSAAKASELIGDYFVPSLTIIGLTQGDMLRVLREAEGARLLAEGALVKTKDGMIFNATATDKS